MNSATVETPNASGTTTTRARVLEATRHAAHLSHEARLLKSLATDAIEDGAYAAKRAIKSVHRGVQRIEGLKDEAIHQVKRQPVKAIAIAAALGLAAGTIIGVISGRCRRADATEKTIR
jgi:ElaB/YqjD/DUF883 family membrane-anchored ribosome-binding protein